MARCAERKRIHMTSPVIHWRPNTAISYPSGPGTMRTFVLKDNIVCSVGRNGCGDWSITRKWVTCKRCLRIASKSRQDTEETIQKVLRRGDPLVEERHGKENK